VINMKKKYNADLCRKRVFLLVPFILLQVLVCAQDNSSGLDTVKELKYEIVDTIVPAEPPVVVSQEGYSEESDDETKDKPEYFLRKEFTGGLADTLQFRRLPERAVKALREDEAFWYANEAFKKKEAAKKKKRGALGFIGQPFFQTLLWLIIIGGFATFLILYLHNSNVGLFRRSAAIAEEETGIEASDIFAINYQKEIDKAVSTGNYRLAIRLMFLRLLRNLSDKNVIQYKQDSTNFDYMMQLRSTPMYSDFFRITRNYEYSWYGQFDIDKDKYSIIKNEFENFENRLNR
jgi:hypothetical protein